MNRFRTLLDARTPADRGSALEVSLRAGAASEPRVADLSSASMRMRAARRGRARSVRAASGC